MAHPRHPIEVRFEIASIRRAAKDVALMYGISCQTVRRYRIEFRADPKNRCQGTEYARERSRQNLQTFWQSPEAKRLWKARRWPDKV